MAFIRSSYERKGSLGLSFLLVVLCFLSSHCDLISAQIPPPVLPTGSSPSPVVSTTSTLPVINVSTIDPGFFLFPATLAYLNAKPTIYRTFTRLLSFPKDKGLTGSYAFQVVNTAKSNITLLVPVEEAWTALGNAVSCLESMGGYNLTDKILRNHIIIGLHNATELRLNPNGYPTAGDTLVSIVSLPTGITANGVNVMVPDKFMTYGGAVLNLDRVILPEDFASQWQAACPAIPSVSPPPAVASVPAPEIMTPVSTPGATEPISTSVPPPDVNPANQSADSVVIPQADGGVGGGAGAGESDGIAAPGSGSSPQQLRGGSSLSKDGLLSFALKLLVTAVLVWTAYSS